MAAPVPGEVAARRVGDAAVVSVVGDCDIAIVPVVQRLLDTQLDTSPPVLVVDLSAATFIDSTCLGAIVTALRRTRETGAALRVVAGTYEIRRPFEITGVGRILTVHDTLEDALSA